MSPIYRGSRKISGLYQDTRKIVKAYLGETLVFDDSPGEFAYTVRVAADQVVTLPFPASNVTSINWGDGTTAVLQTHRYTSAGDYHITMVTTGTLPQFNFTSDPTLRSIDTWTFRCAGWTDVSLFCSGCTNLTSLCTGMFKGAVSANADSNSMYNGMFANCTSLSAVPGDLFKYLYENKTLNGVFYNCAALKSVPENLFAPLVNLESMQHTFSSSGLTAIPATLYATLTKVTGLNGNFANTSVSTIPGALYANCGAVTTLGNEFEGTKVTEIPAGLFSSLPNLRAVRGTFKNCTLLTTVPSTIFDTCVGINEIDGLFSGCTALPSFPKIFAMLADVTILKNVFENCPIPSSIPSDLFRHNTNVTEISSVFRGCTGLTAVPPEVFRYNTVVQDFSSVFDGCTGLTTIPSDPFLYSTKAVDLSYVYRGCANLYEVGNHWFEGPYIASLRGALAGTAIEEVDRNFVKYKNSVKDISEIFAGCVKLTRISSGRADGTLTDFDKVEKAEGICRGCTELTGVTISFFQFMVSVTTLQRAFFGCSKLVNLPSGLFSKQVNCRNYSELFSNAIALTNVPSVLFPATLESATSFRRAFYMCSNINTDVPALWNSPVSSNNGSDCYYGCTSAANYASIPTAWK